MELNEKGSILVFCSDISELAISWSEQDAILVISTISMDQENSFSLTEGIKKNLWYLLCHLNLHTPLTPSGFPGSTHHLMSAASLSANITRQKCPGY